MLGGKWQYKYSRPNFQCLMAILFCLCMLATCSDCIDVKQLLITFVPHADVEVSETAIVADHIGSVQLLWCLHDLCKEGKVILEPVVSYHDCREKKKDIVKKSVLPFVPE